MNYFICRALCVAVLPLVVTMHAIDQGIQENKQESSVQLMTAQDAWQIELAAQKGAIIESFLPARELRTIVAEYSMFTAQEVAEANQALSQASIGGNIGLLQEALAMGASVNFLDQYGYFPLNHAAARGDSSMVSLLLAARSDVNGANRLGTTSLLMSAQHGDADIVQLLLGSGANSNLANKYREIPLKYAARYGYTKIVSMLLGAGAHVTMKSDAWGYVPLCDAVKKGYTEIVSMLVLAGALVHDTEQVGQIAVDSAKPEIRTVIVQAHQAREKALRELHEQEQLMLDLHTVKDFSIPDVHRLCGAYAAPYCKDPFLQQMIELEIVRRKENLSSAK